MALNFLNDAYFAATVGIGVEVPTYTLELQVSQPDENPVVYSQFGGNNGVTGNSFLQIGGARGSAASERYSYLQTLDGAGGFRILSLNPSGGNVGIGTTLPSAKLEINGGTTADTPKLLIAGNDSIIKLGSNHLGGPHGIQFDYENNVASDGMSMYYRTSPEYLAFEDSTGVSGNALMVIQRDGNVGIGTTGPYAFDTTATKLHVKNTGSSGSLSEIARFEGSSDADGSGGTIRLGTSNDRGIYFEGGRTGSVPYGKIGTTEYDGTKTLAITLDNTGNATFAGDIIGGGSITIGSGGGYNAGVIYSDANWGMIFRAKQASPLLADFLFTNSADVERLRITSTGATFTGSVVTPTVITDNVVAKTSSGNITFKNNSGSTIAQFYNDLSSTFAGDVTVGTGIIKASIGGDIAIVQGSIGLRINDNLSALTATTASLNNDNVVSLGTSSIRFKDLRLGGSLYGNYATGTISTNVLAFTQANAINNTTIATTAYVNNKIALIPAGLLFEGTWDARTVAEGGTGNPPSASPANGQFWIVSVDGSINLSGITDWKVGDWAIYVVAGAGTDGWQKVDNSSVLDGIGTGQTLPLWAGSGTSNTLTDSRFTQTSTSNQAKAPAGSGTRSFEALDSSGNSDFHVLGSGEVIIPSNYLYVSSSQGAYIDGTLRARGGITDDGGVLSLGGGGLTTNLQLTGGGASGSARFYGSTETTGNVVTGPNITAIGNTGNSTLTLQANTGNWTFTNVQASRNLEISDSDGTGTVMTIDTGGNVGIGTTSPDAKLEVSSTALVSGDARYELLITEDNTASAGRGGGLAFTRQGIIYGGIKTLQNTANDDNTSMYFQTRGGGTVSNRMTIDEIGNVGIGVIDPQAKLEVKGISATPGDGNEIISVTNTLGGSKLLLGVVENSYGWIQSAEGSTYRNLLLNPLGGNVGIATSTPTNYRLEVNGTVKGSSFGTDESTTARIFAPSGAAYNGGGTQTGYLIMELPDNAGAGINNMMSGVIRVFDYAVGKSFDVRFSGYWYSGYNWTNCTAYVINEPGVERNFPVKFGKSTGASGSEDRPYIAIGDTASTWFYCKFSVIEYTSGHSNAALYKWDSGWAASLSSTLPGSVLITVSNTQTNNWKRLGSDMYNGNSGNVGIGMTPRTVGTYKVLDISGSGTAGGYIGFNTGTTSQAEIYSNSTSFEFVAIGNKTIKFYANGGERMVISSAGAIKFNAYNSTNNTGTPTYLLGTDASGNVVKTNSAPSPITSQAASLYDLIPNGAFTTTYAFTSTAGTYAEVMESNDVITATGTYSVQVAVSDYAVGGTQYTEVYSGVMTWYAASTNDNGGGAISEISLHRAGHAANQGVIYLRTRETSSPDNVLKLEIMCNRTYTGASNIIFKFVRLI